MTVKPELRFEKKIRIWLLVKEKEKHLMLRSDPHFKDEVPEA